MSNCTYKVKIKDIQNNYKVIMEDIQNKYKFKIFCTGNSYDDTEIREEIEALQDELDDAEEELEQYKTIYNALPKVTGEGSNITLNNTANSVMKFKEYKGDTYQETTTGKNYFKASSSNYPQGLTITNNTTTGEITFSGTTTGSYPTLSNFTDANVPAGEYTFSIDKTLPYNITLRFRNASGQYPTSITIPSGSLYNTTTTSYDAVRLEIVYNINSSGITVPTTTIKPMLESGSTATSFEPFTNGASPNPSYPQNIEVVTGTQNVEVCGKNLNNGIDYKFYIGATGTQYRVSGNDAGLCIEVNGISSYTISTTTTQNRYRVACCNSLPTTTEQRCYNGTKKDGTSDNIIINTSGYKYLLVNATDLTAIQIEQGSTATTYEAYTGTTYPVNLGNIELCKIDTYQDRIYKSNNKWYLEKNIGNHTINSDDAVSPGGTSTDGYARCGWGLNSEIATSDFTKTLVVCNKFLGVPQNDNTTSATGQHWYCSVSNNNNFKIMFRAGDSTITRADFPNFIKTNNVTVYYPLETPTTTEITDTTLIGQLEAISKQLSYKGQTNIIVSGNLPVIINSEALKDLSTEETPVASVTRLQSVRPTIIQPEINNIEEQPEEIEEEIPEQE